MNSEKPAKGVRGFILRDFSGERYFFRIYQKDESGRIVGHNDYDLTCEELEVEIMGSWQSFYEDKHKLDWSSQTLHGKPGDRVVRISPKTKVRTEGHLDKDLKFVSD